MQQQLVRDFMPVLATSKFDEDPIKNERASLETPFSHCKYGKFFRHSRAPNSIVSGPIWPKFELIQDLMHVLVTCKYKKNWVKNNRESQWALSVSMETKVLIQPVPKPYATFPSP